ncbi:MAG: outer membrane protein assembly factor BamD [Burkholderiales bacterium]
MKRSVALFALLLAACGSLGEKSDPTAGWSAERLYHEAKDELDNSNYEQAAKYYESLESRYPYGRFAQQAQIEAAYAYFKQGESASAVAAVERFIKLHPNHPSVDYAYYLKGLIYFNEDLGVLGKIAHQDTTERDPKSAQDSFDAFKELVQLYPDSKYTPDAIARMKYLVNALASHEIHVARYYMKRGAYIAAANRAQYALRNYAQAPASEEAVLILVKAYDALGMNKLRDDAERVLKTNFPDSAYLKKMEIANSDSWWKFW